MNNKPLDESKRLTVQNLNFKSLYDGLFDQVMMQREVSAQEISGLTKLLNLPLNSLVLDQGCGTGIISIALSKNGYRIVGIDQMPLYIQQAQEKAQELGLTCNFYTSSFVDFKPYQKFNGVFSWWTSWGHGNDQENYQTIQAAYDCLEQGGNYVIDWMNVPGILANFKTNFTSEHVTQKWGKIIMDRSISIVKNNDPKELTDATICTEWTYTLGSGEQITRSTQMKMYMPDHIAGMLEKAGFQTIKVLGDDGQSLNTDHRRVHLVASK